MKTLQTAKQQIKKCQVDNFIQTKCEQISFQTRYSQKENYLHVSIETEVVHIPIRIILRNKKATVSTRSET